MKKHFWKLEYSITLFVLLGFLMLLTPVKLENYWQAQMITRWNDKLDKVSYMFSVINAQITDEILKSFSIADSPEQREKLLLQLIKPYLRIHQTDKFPKRYKPKFLDGSRVPRDDKYYFSDLYFSENNLQIVGIKDIANEKNNGAWFMLMFDLNGLLPPNTWGKDIYGIYIYDEGKVVPFGYEKNLYELKQSCPTKGVDCSYYYTIGGEFND